MRPLTPQISSFSHNYSETPIFFTLFTFNQARNFIKRCEWLKLRVSRKFISWIRSFGQTYISLKMEAPNQKPSVVTDFVIYLSQGNPAKCQTSWPWWENTRKIWPGRECLSTSQEAGCRTDWLTSPNRSFSIHQATAPHSICSLKLYFTSKDRNSEMT